MTCIVGIEHETGVYIGGDSATIAGWTLELTDRPKVFRVGEFLIGVAGSPRVAGLIRHTLAPPPVPKKAKRLDRYMVTEFVPAMRAALFEGAAEKHLNDVAAVPDSSALLVGVRGRLYQVYSDYQVTGALGGYSAIGCADAVALGSLFSTATETRLAFELDPEPRVLIALSAAEAHNIGVRGPFIIEHLPTTPKAPAPAARKQAAR